MTIKKVDETLLTDEKICKVNPLWNSHNNRVYASVSIKSGIPRKRFWIKPQDHFGSEVISAGYFSAGQNLARHRRISSNQILGFVSITPVPVSSEI